MSARVLNRLRAMDWEEAEACLTDRVLDAFAQLLVLLRALVLRDLGIRHMALRELDP